MREPIVRRGGPNIRRCPELLDIPQALEMGSKHLYFQNRRVERGQHGHNVRVNDCAYPLVERYCKS